MNRQTRILVVDDSSTMRKIIRNLLLEIGFSQIDEAGDGGLALSKLRTGHFNLIISDWEMVRMSGLDLVQQVRNDARLNSLPFIMVTAEAGAQKITAAKQAGVTNYVVKPFNAQTMRQKIEAAMGVLL